ncbi:MAG TPA: hypothetical protein VFP61_11735 [Acidimicrobiales bacterium]|nr:hypothetical protein [Acidimicrobiales bacterium]
MTVRARLAVWLVGDIEPLRRHGPVEHCLTCQERADLLRRGRSDCTIPEHDRAIQRLGYYRRQLAEIAAQRDDALEQVTVLRARLRHPSTRQQEAA